MAVLHYRGGAMGQWTQSYAAHGQGFGQRVLYGSQGSLRPGGTRNGRSPVLVRSGGDELSGAPLLDLVPDFSVEITCLGQAFMRTQNRGAGCFHHNLYDLFGSPAVALAAGSGPGTGNDSFLAELAADLLEGLAQG